MLLVLLALQATAPAASAPPERFSILVPVAPQPCPPRTERKGEKDEVVVCATELPDQTVPYPQEYVYDGPRPSNPGLTGTGALAAASTPCAAMQDGCQVGFGAPIVAALLNGAVDLVRDATRKRDKRPRVRIDISEPVKPAP